MDTGDGVHATLDRISAAASFSTATLYEAAGCRVDLPAAIKPLVPTFKICGPAVTVSSPPKDNLWLHRAIYVARPGDVLVVDTGEAYEAGYWGEIMTRAAIERRLGGLVIDGCVRDGERLENLCLPIFARGLCVRGTTKDKQAEGGINRSIRIGDITVGAGNVVVGDRDGVVAIPYQLLSEVLAEAREREEKEARLIEALRAGATTLDIYGLN